MDEVLSLFMDAASKVLAGSKVAAKEQFFERSGSSRIKESETGETASTTDIFSTCGRHADSIL